MGRGGAEEGSRRAGPGERDCGPASRVPIGFSTGWQFGRLQSPQWRAAVGSIFLSHLERFVPDTAGALAGPVPRKHVHTNRLTAMTYGQVSADGASMHVHAVSTMSAARPVHCLSKEVCKVSCPFGSQPGCLQLIARASTSPSVSASRVVRQGAPSFLILVPQPATPIKFSK